MRTIYLIQDYFFLRSVKLKSRVSENRRERDRLACNKIYRVAGHIDLRITRSVT